MIVGVTRIAALVGLLLGGAVGGMPLQVAAQSDQPGGIDITIVVSPEDGAAPTSPAPESGSGSDAGAGAGFGSSTSGSGSFSPAGAAEAVPDAVTVSSGDDEQTRAADGLGGVLYLSGLESDYNWSIDPFGGTVVSSFTVRNVSETTIDGSADFWVDGPFGNRISADEQAVEALAPGESRLIRASLPAIGQWTMVTVHGSFTPPDQVEGIQLTTQEREATMIVPPALLLALLGAGALTAAAIAHRRGRMTAPESEPAMETVS